MQAPLARTVGVHRDDHHRDYGDEVRYCRDEADLKSTQARKAANNLRQPQCECILAKRNAKEHEQTKLPHDPARERPSDAETMMHDASAPPRPTWVVRAPATPRFPADLARNIRPPRQARRQERLPEGKATATQ